MEGIVLNAKYPLWHIISPTLFVSITCSLQCPLPYSAHYFSYTCSFLYLLLAIPCPLLPNIHNHAVAALDLPFSKPSGSDFDFYFGSIIPLHFPSSTDPSPLLLFPSLLHCILPLLSIVRSTEIILGTSMGLLYVLSGSNGFAKRFFPMQFNAIQVRNAFLFVPILSLLMNEGGYRKSLF
jgi:hypothetical protein